MRPELSILIPTYNHEAFTLVETLSREAELLELDYEILLYDDGSTKERESNSRVIDFPKTNYKYFEENKGRSTTRRRLANDARFNWLLLLDADVLPADSNFLKTYLAHIRSEWDAICGGVGYSVDPPESGRMLRYKYGKEREATSAAHRNKDPFFILTGNLLIKKNLFLGLTKDMSDFYGEDLLISQRLKRNNTAVKHIDNPIIHLGIEDSEEYLKKSMEVLRNIVRLEKKGEMDSDFTRLQQKYNAMKSSGTLFPVNTITSVFQGNMLKNLTSGSPNLKYFDLYRLKYYSDLKKNA